MTHDGGFLAAVAMWQVMVSVMMTPTVRPWARAYVRLVAPGPDPRAASAAGPFVAGYFAVWLAYSVAMAAVQTGLASVGVLVGDRLTSTAGALVLIAAGAFQFTPLKAACLTHCRNPLTYFLARWHDGPIGGFRLGVSHGAYCLGCCWGLMLTGLALGAMNLVWMAALTALVAVEQVSRHGVRIGRLAGAVLVCWGLWRLG
jgi:predicted metal-binding membrane protein